MMSDFARAMTETTFDIEGCRADPQDPTTIRVVDRRSSIVDRQNRTWCLWSALLPTARSKAKSCLRP